MIWMMFYLAGECSVDGNSCDRGIEDECSSHSSQEDVELTKEVKVDRLERKSKSMPSDILDILDEKSKENSVENVQFLSDREDDSDDVPVWEPPEPENPEDEVDGVFADDDDDCCDGSKWNKASLLGELSDESSEKRKVYEENRRVMLEEADSKFKFIVSQLIKSAGFSIEESGYWFEIVARLCWEAASMLKPAIDGKSVDPTEYIKVKCIATGSCVDRYNKLPIFCLDFALFEVL
jgi:1-phosphatidylinositol-3-phosphate 5-kinase